MVVRTIAGRTFGDLRRSEDIRQELLIMNILDIIELHRRKLMEHLSRMNDECLSKHILNNSQKGRESYIVPGNDGLTIVSAVLISNEICFKFYSVHIKHISIYLC